MSLTVEKYWSSSPKKQYIYKPQEDISSFELATLIPYLIASVGISKQTDHQILQQGLKIGDEVFLKLSEKCKRHFYECHN